MLAHEKYAKVFGRLSNLADQESWSTGVSNMLEWLTWSTANVLGISKTEYRKRVVELCFESGSSDVADANAYVTKILKKEMDASERIDRYARATYTVGNARELLRRSKYFSEDYLNKEFDIFWSLASDLYLDEFYSQFTDIAGGHRWSTHGNNGMFEHSTRINDTFMDNLSYNEDERLLVANELKLGGKKNPDQMLKYSLLFQQLMERGFIHEDTRLLLLFIGDKEQQGSWDDLLENEIEYCRSSKKEPARKALFPEVISLAQKAQYASTTWSDLVEFNNTFGQKLDSFSQQVEMKLLWGFNESLSAKAFINDK